MEVQAYIADNKIQCTGCGVIIQTDNEKELGYLNEEKLQDIISK